MKFNVNIKFNIAFFLGLIILASLWKGKEKGKEKEKEGYVTGKSAAADNLGNELNSVVDEVGDKTLSALDTIAEFIAPTTTVILPKWNSVYGDGTSVPDTVTTGLKPDTSLILTDGCSKKSILRSDYANDICTIHAGDYPTINKKCNALSKDNCNLPSCCVLLNGTKCVAGDADGPTYLTDQGNTIDYYYYYHRNKCYGAGCNDAANLNQVNCGGFADNSVGVSKACMVQLFNNAGCSNTKPQFVIDDDYVYNKSKSSKKYIQNDLTETAKTLLSEISKGDDDSRIKCSADYHNPCDKFLSYSNGISQDCMVKMYNDAGCPNEAPPLITDQYVSNMSGFNKTAVKNAITNEVTTIKNSADDGTVAGNIPKCYGIGVTVSPNAKITALTPAPVPMNITNDFTGPAKCLDIVNDSQRNKLILNACSNNDATNQGQKWLKVPNTYAPGTYSFKNNLSGTDKCLDIAGDGTKLHLIMNTCSSVTGQRWNYSVNITGRKNLTNNYTGPNKCIDVVNDGANNKLIMVDCGSASATGQSWHMA